MTVKLWNARHGEIDLSLGSQPLIVGRAGSGVDVELKGDDRLSRRHARLWQDGSEAWFEDLGSANGSWRYGERLAGPSRLIEGVPIVLGETSVVLVKNGSVSVRPEDLTEGTPETLTVDDMHVILRREAATHALAESAVTSGRAVTYISELYEFVALLLRSTSRELISRALLRIYEVVPAAQRIALIAWPPEPDGSFRHVLPPEDLARKGGQAGPISTSLSRYAVERREALLLTDTFRPPDLKVGKSVAQLTIRSAVYVPVMATGSEVLGVLCVDTPEPARPFSTPDFEFICAVAGLLGSALEAESLRQSSRVAQMHIGRSESRRESLMAFLKIASHDLKNPLAAIHLSASVLPRVNNPATIKEILQVIHGAGTRAEDLVRSYLEVAAVEAGQPMRVQRKDLDLKALVDEEILFIEKTQDDPSRLQVENHVAGLQVHADAQKVRQILSNLLSNAVKYSPQGGRIEIAAETRDGEVQIRVRDHGVGISEEDKKRLFLQFERVGDLSLATGTGLGLWLSATLVQAHGGRMWVETPEGAGSIFAFSLPQ